MALAINKNEIAQNITRQAEAEAKLAEFYDKGYFKNLDNPLIG